MSHEIIDQMFGSGLTAALSIGEKQVRGAAVGAVEERAMKHFTKFISVSKPSPFSSSASSISSPAVQAELGSNPIKRTAAAAAAAPSSLPAEVDLLTTVHLALAGESQSPDTLAATKALKAAAADPGKLLNQTEYCLCAE